ncbi:MAG: hypothetical protein AAGA05_01805, partial [Pseudomonadota bacterium]
MTMAGLAACSPAPGTRTSYDPVYEEVETRLLDEDLVQFQLAMNGARGPSDIEEFADCAAAQYALIRGYGFARHLRTNTKEEGGVWRADAVYTISPSL